MPPTDLNAVPTVKLTHLDHLWFQVAGTLCNLTCHHCFISCSPKNDSFGFLSLAEVEDYLKQSVPLGVKEYYFTGGEPFLNPDMVPILERTLDYGPATVLTNATVWKEEWIERLRRAEENSIYSLEFRVSIDGFSPETNDPIRGEGTFERAMRGVERLVTAGFLPIITATRTWEWEREQEVLAAFTEVLQQRGYTQPRLKILPTLQMGAEEDRSHGYSEDERVTQQLLEGFDYSQLVCDHSRIVTSRGIYVCPILIETAHARLGEKQLSQSLEPFPMSEGACYTCFQYGSICSNVNLQQKPGSEQQ